MGRFSLVYVTRTRAALTWLTGTIGGGLFVYGWSSGHGALGVFGIVLAFIVPFLESCDL